MNNEASANVGLKAESIDKYFSGVPALSGASLTLRPGEVVGLIGHNGAGKSTLLKVIAGAHKHDGGTLTIDGEEVSFNSPAEALGHGVATVYQELSLLPNLTISQNTWLGREKTGATGLKEDEMRKASQEVMDSFGLDVDVDRKASTYPVAIRQMIEIAIATTKDTRYLLLDEPTTSLEGDQVDRLLDYIKKLAKEKNLGILLVDHKLDELYAVCDHIVALVDGKEILAGPVSVVTQDKVVEAIVGEAAASDETTTADASARLAQLGDEVFSCKGLTGDLINDVELSVRAGEIVGLYGLVGAGRTEFLRTLIGIEKMVSGEVIFQGKKFAPKDPKHASKHGIVYLTEERKHDGIVPQMDSIRNAALPVLKDFTKFGWLNTSTMSKKSREVLDSLRIRGSVDGPVVSLSGGNQQKVLLARTLMQKPKLLLLDEPTKGVDIGVKAEIHRLLREMAEKENICIIVASSEEEEILEVSDSVVIFSHGTTSTAKLPAHELSIAKLREYAWA